MDCRKRRGEKFVSLLNADSDTGVCRYKLGSVISYHSCHVNNTRVMQDTMCQVLVDIFNRGRYTWKYWDMFTNPSVGSLGFSDKVGLVSL